jgi:hypothetical protein
MSKFEQLTEIVVGKLFEGKVWEVENTLFLWCDRVMN